MSYPPPNHPPHSGGHPPQNPYPHFRGHPPHNYPPNVSYQYKYPPRRRRYFILTGVFAALPILLLIVVMALKPPGSSPPDVDTCLRNLEKGLFGGLNTVQCGASSAKYRVVATSDTSSNGSEVCADHPRGTVFQREGDESDENDIAWEICVEPLP